MNPKIRRRIAVATLLPMAFVAAACSSASEKIGEKAAEKAAENALEQEGGGNVDIDTKDGSVKIETKDGTFESDGDGNFKAEGKDGTITGGTSMPDGWPEDVPLPDGVEVTYGSSTPQGMSVTFSSSDSAEDVFEAVKAILDGWKVEDETSMNTPDTKMRSAQFKDGKRALFLTVSESSDGTIGNLNLTTDGES